MWIELWVPCLRGGEYRQHWAVGATSPYGRAGPPLARLGYACEESCAQQGARLVCATHSQLRDVFAHLENFDVSFFNNSRAVELVHSFLHKGTLQVRGRAWHCTSSLFVSWLRHWL